VKKRFEIKFLEDADKFLEGLEEKARDKIIYNIDYVKFRNDKERFNKLSNEIWEFRTLFKKKYYRLFAFWDKTSKVETLVVATHGIIKKSKKTPKSEIEKAENIRSQFFKHKR